MHHAHDCPCLPQIGVCRRQRQDDSLKRGGEQLSVVVLSEHPFSSPLTPLSQVAGPLYFSLGAPALKQVSPLVCVCACVSVRVRVRVRVSV